MTNSALDIARQRAQSDTAAFTSPVSPRPTVTDWGALRGPTDPNSDGGISIVSLPQTVPEGLDDGGLGSDTHPGNEPFKKLLARPKDELTEDEQGLLYDHLVERERARQEERDFLALEQEKFDFHKKKSFFSLLKRFIVGFGVLAAASFTALIGVLIWVSIKKTDFSDTSVVTAILNTFSSFFQILANL